MTDKRILNMNWSMDYMERLRERYVSKDEFSETCCRILEILGREEYDKFIDSCPSDDASFDAAVREKMAQLTNNEIDMPITGGVTQLIGGGMSYPGAVMKGAKELNDEIDGSDTSVRGQLLDAGFDTSGRL